MNKLLIEEIMVNKSDGAIYHNKTQIEERKADIKNMISLGDMYKGAFMYNKIEAMANWIIDNDIHDINHVENIFLKGK